MCENHYHVALAAKQHSLVTLNTALSNMTPKDMDAILAIVLLLVEFKLLAGGQTEWKHHIRGARSLIEMVYRDHGFSASTPLRRCLIANCMMYGYKRTHS